jgi:S1-C subfamily serine protease
MNNIFIKIIVFAILLNIGCGIEQVLSDKIDLNNEINDEKTDLNVSLLKADNLFAELLTTVDVVRKLTPSVVQISTEQLALGDYNQVIPKSGVGSGVILDDKGHILTNNHVVEGRETVKVNLSDGRTFTASIIGSDTRTDLAVIKINATGLIPARLGQSASLLVGEDVIAVGHALGLKGGPTVSKGVVSALQRTIDIDAQMSMVDLIQTDASINPGNSGGPLLNLYGEVIGINTAIIDNSNGIGFAINIDDAKIIISQLLSKGFVSRGFIGISPFNITSSLKNQLNLSFEEGVLVGKVIEGFPAAIAGIKIEDVIVRIDDVLIANSGDLSKFLINHMPGDEIIIYFYRDGELKEANIILDDAP